MDWADERAREWLAKAGIDAKRRIPVGLAEGATREDNLAKLLREVGTVKAAYRDQLLADVRRVVEERLAYGRDTFGTDWTGADLRWLLSRLVAEVLK